MALELGHVSDRKPPFKYAAYDRIGFSDTDAQGIVYYGRYMPFVDLARVEYHRHLGMTYGGRRRRREFVMRALTIDFLAPARFDDLIEVFVRVSRIGHTSVTYEYAAYRLDDDLLLVTGHQTVVLVELATHSTSPVPESFRKAIRAFEGDDLEE
jgi:acyl-CoA thioester hydrolase